MKNRKVMIRFATALALAGVLAGARFGMHISAAPVAGFPTLPNMKSGEGDTVSLAVAVIGQVPGVTYTATGLPAHFRIDNETFTDGTGTHSRGVIRGTWNRGAAGTDPVSNAGSYTGDEGIYNVTIHATAADLSTSTSNTFTWDVGRWGSGDVFVGGGTFTYQVYTKDSDFRYDVKVGDPLTEAGFTAGCSANWRTGEIWATNFENNVNVITRHAGSALTPYADPTRTVSTLRFSPGALYPTDVSVESIAFDNSQNMFVGHSYGWANNNNEYSDQNGKAVWLDDIWTIAARFVAATTTTTFGGYYIDWNFYKTTRTPTTPGPIWDDGGAEIGQAIYPTISLALWNEARATWGTTGDWNVRKQEGAGLVTVDAAGSPILDANNSYILFDTPVSPDGFYEKWTNGVASYVLNALGAKIPLREQAGMDIHKYPTGALGYGSVPATYFNPRYGFTGADTLDMFSDQKTVIYTSENPYIYRFDLATNTQLPVVGSSVLSSGASLTDLSHPVTLPAPSASDPNVPPSVYGVRLLPPGDGTGGYLVLNDAEVMRLDANGRVVQTYDAKNLPCPSYLDPGACYPNGDAEGWFSVAVAPDGRSFWAATRQDVFHFDIASGVMLGTPIHATDGVVHTATVVDGLCVVDEYRAAREDCGLSGNGNGIDDDGDGVIDNGCFRVEMCSAASPGDDDGNGLADYNDPACYPTGQPPATVCATNGNTDPSVAGFCARQNAEGDTVAIDSVPPPCGTSCSGWTFTYSATGLPAGLTINPTTGQITGSPAYSIIANLITAPPQVFPIVVNASWTQSGNPPVLFTGRFNWTITNTNRPPVAADDTARVAAGSTVVIDAKLNDSDPDSIDIISIVPGSLTTPLNAALQPTGSVSVTVDGKLQYSAPAGASGPVTFFYQVKDNYGVPGVSNQAKVTVTVNGAPVAQNDTYTMLSGTSLTVTAANGVILNTAGRDTDPENSVLTVSSNTAPSHGSLTLNSDGSFTYTPLPGFAGTDTFTYVVTDGELTSNTATVTIIVPAPPVANNDAYTTQLNTALVVNSTLTGLLANDSDPQGRALRVSAFTTPLHGSVVMSAANDGTFTYTPTTGYSGTDTFTYKVNNGQLDSNTATVTITILTTNHPPVAGNDSYLVNQGNTLTVPAGGILANDSDPDRDLLTAQLVTGPASGTFAFTAGTGAFTFTPAVGFSGDVTFTYLVSDPYGLSSAPATVTIHVNAPPVAVNDAYTTAEDTTLTVPARGILINDTDIDAGAVLAVVLPVVTQPAHGTVTVSADGSFVYVPALNYNGTDTFTYRVVDDHGAVSAIPATVTITITPVNDPPVAVNDSYTTPQATPLVISNVAQGVIQRNDTDVDNPVSTLVANVLTLPSRGTLSFTTNGTFTYTPQAPFSGTDTFTYFVVDPQGGTSNTATVTITVLATSISATTTPVCSTNAAYVDYSLSAVNFAFPSGSTARIDWIDSSTRIVRTDLAQPLSGRVLWPGMVLASGVAVDWPGWVLNGVVWVEGVDGFELTKPAVTVRFTVGTVIREVSVAYPAAVTGCNAAPPTNQAPIATNDTYSTSVNTTLTVPAAGILTNDRDPEGGALTVNFPLTNSPTSGTLTQNADGSFTFVPATNFIGAVTYSYRAKDPGNVLSNIATVTINVLGNTTVTVPNVTATYDGVAKPTTCTVRGSDGTSLLGVLTYTGGSVPVHAGTYTATCTFNGDGRYLPASGTGTVTILPRPLTITANNSAKTYGTTATFAGTEFTTAGLVSPDSVSAVTLASAGAAANATVAGSPYAITPSAATGTGLTDYAITYVNGALTVNKAPLTVTASNQSKVYGTALTFAGTEFTTSGLLLTDTVTSATITSAGAAAAAAAGTYAITPSVAVGTGLANYNVTYANGTLTVGKPVITVTASSAAVTYGDPKPTITPSYSGFVNGDTSAVVTTAPVCVTAYTTTSAPGTTPSTSCSGAAASNYTFVYVSGQVTIAAKAAVVNAGSGTKAYGSADPTLTTTTSGFLTADLSGIALSTTRQAGEAVGSYGTTATATGGNVGNYTVTYNPGTFTITKATPVAVAVGGTFTFDGQPHGGTCTITGVNGAVLTGTVSYSSGTVPTATGTYTLTCSYPGDANYNAVSATATITITSCEAGASTTYTQGGWGSTPNGTNPGSLLATKFATIYPAGFVQVGGGRTLKFTTAAAIEAFLPAGGSPNAITSNATNPTYSKGGVFAGQVLALQLNVDFSNGRVTKFGLANKTVASGKLAGYTVTQVLALANGVLGGAALPTGMTTSELNAIVDAINQNFDNGTVDRGFLLMEAGCTPANRAPVAVNDAYTTLKNTRLTVAVPGVMLNDSDPDKDPITVQLVSTTTHGTLSLAADGSFSYLPANNYVGSDTFTYRVQDKSGLNSNVATVTITITQVVCNLTANADTYATNKSHSITLLAAGGVLANDADPYDRGITVSEVLGSSAKVGVWTATAHGSVRVNVDGSFTYTPATGYVGSDSFTYKMRSAYNNTVSNQATATIIVAGHYEGDGCDHDKSWGTHRDGDGCAHDKALARHYAGDGCDHDRKRNGHHDGDGCGHDSDLHRHRAGDACAHELGGEGHAAGDQCEHELSQRSHYDGDGCYHEWGWWAGHYNGDGCTHERQTSHHNDGDNCDHERGINGHEEGDACSHEREGHGHGAGDQCDHDRKANGHSDGDRCEHDEHRGDEASDANPCVANETDHHHYGDGDDHHSGDNDDTDGGHHSGDYCDHDRKKNGHKDGDGCAHDRIVKHYNGDSCDHDRKINGHKDGDKCDHDRSNRDDHHDHKRGGDDAPAALPAFAPVVTEDRRD